MRAHRLAILRELAQDYDIDGVELDFVRWGKCFAREEAPFKIGIMTSFVGEVRGVLDEAARKRGRDRLVLGVQVMRSLYLCHLAGLDPGAWVQQGWADYLIQCDFNCTDPQIPVAEFTDFCAGSRCTHHVRMGNLIGGRWTRKPDTTGRKTRLNNNCGYSGMVLTPEEARGAAANIYGFGANGIGFWNVCCNMGNKHKPGTHPGVPREEFQEDLLRWAAEVARPENVWRGRRVYHFVPIYKGETIKVRNYPVNELRTGPMGEPTQIVAFNPDSKGLRQIFRFLMADGRDGEKLVGTLLFRILQSTSADQFVFDINRQPIDPARARTEAVADEELPYLQFEFDLADCPPFAGQNELGITPIKIVGHQPADDYAASLYGSVPYLEELIVTVDDANQPAVG